MTDEERLKAAMWVGDVNALCELAPCVCCCAEHTFESCPARAWNGCRGSDSLTRADVESWVRHYAGAPHWMTRAEFFGGEGSDESSELSA